MGLCGDASSPFSPFPLLRCGATRWEKKRKETRGTKKNLDLSVSTYRLVVALDCVCSSTLPTNRERESRLSFAKSPNAQNRLAQEHDRSAMMSSPPPIHPLSCMHLHLHWHWHQPSHKSRAAACPSPDQIKLIHPTTFHSI